MKKCLDLFAVALGWLLLDIRWFVLELLMHMNIRSYTPLIVFCHYDSFMEGFTLILACEGYGEEEEDEDRIEELSEDLSDCRDDLSEPDSCPTCPTCEDCGALLARFCMAYSPTNSLQECSTCLNLGVANCDLSTCEVIGTDPFDFCVSQENPL